VTCLKGAAAISSDRTDVPATCPMGRPLGVLREYPRTGQHDHPPVAVLASGILALIPKLIVLGYDGCDAAGA
jgi:hypothetical protein